MPQKLKIGMVWEKQRKEDEAAIEEFLKSGGQIVELREGGESYDKQLEKHRKKFPGGINPFSKEETLKVRD